MFDSYVRRAKLARVVDGDTVDLHVDLGFGVVMWKVRVRLLGINAPESRTRDLEEKARGLAATAFVQKWMDDGVTEENQEWPLLLQSVKGERGKYGRWLGDIYRELDGAKLTAVLVKTGHAVKADYS